MCSPSRRPHAQSQRLGFVAEQRKTHFSINATVRKRGRAVNLSGIKDDANAGRLKSAPVEISGEPHMGDEVSQEGVMVIMLT